MIKVEKAIEKNTGKCFTRGFHGEKKKYHNPEAFCSPIGQSLGSNLYTISDMFLDMDKATGPKHAFANVTKPYVHNEFNTDNIFNQLAPISTKAYCSNH